MSIQAVAWALDQDLPARPKLVLVSICNHADHTNGYCWLRAATIAREAACTPRSVYNFVGALVRNGYIRKALRRGEDGKQRATDYWIMFGREQKPWEFAGHVEAPEAEDEPDDIAATEVEPPDMVEPHERDSTGENDEPHERHDSRRPVEMSPRSCGPVESAFIRHESAEPSKSKPEKDAGARARATGGLVSGPPRSYQPPPPSPEQPMGAIIADREAKQIFVYLGSRAWDAWVRHKKQTTGVQWSLTTTSVVDGRRRVGWYFPSLFPPETGSTGPPPPNITKDDDEFVNRQEGLG